MKKILLAYAWMLATTFFVLLSIGVWHFTRPETIASLNGTTNSEAETVQLNSESVTAIKGVSTTLETDDGRVEIVAKFLERYNSPLTPYDHFGQVFVDIADRYGFDFRLLPSIAMQESNLCKTIPEGSYNCLGFGIHARGTLKFPNFEANFERAGRELKANYIDIGLTTPEKIMKKYTPSSDGSWANSVNQWMAEMRYDDRQLGRELKTDADVMEFAKITPTALPTPGI